MSTATMSVMWFYRKVRQVGEGTLGRHGRYLPTVAWLFNTKLDQFTVNSRRSPKRVGHAHWGEDLPGVGAHLGPPGAIFTAPASTAGNPCDATGSRSPASPAPWH